MPAPKLRALLRACASLLLLAGSHAAHAQDLREQVRESVEQLRDAGPSGPRLEGVSLSEGIARFYEQRDFAPAWNDRRLQEALVTQLRGVAADGLDPQDYALARIEQGPASADSSALAAWDLMATRNYLLALAHLFRGKVDPATLDAQWNFSTRTMTPDEALRYMVEAVRSGNIAGVFDGARPTHPAYGRLRAALARLRAIEAAGGWPQITGGKTLKPGMDDPRVAALRRRLAATGDLAAADDNGSTLYDATVEAAVQRFQSEQYLTADGAIGAGTRNALNLPVEKRIGQLRANLERGRWLLHELHDDFLLVDIAGFQINLFRKGESVWSSRVQVGKAARSTPVFKSEITYLNLNPTWTVPPTILREDLLPKLRRDPRQLQRLKLRVFDVNGQELAPEDIDWNKPGRITLRQDAGAGNALGRAVIRFPNPYSVYLHDTPHQELFDASQRAFSSGCIRVENVLELVQLLLADPAWDKAAIDTALTDEQTRSLRLPQPLPILLAYWTVDVPENGRVGFKADIYDRDTPLLKALAEKPRL
ncbi:MAG TPA: L,D-transpeptidase family protein [Solimonas sp.]|nr:L,D-transpeptidase family protein [Solimonas sp.]